MEKVLYLVHVSNVDLRTKNKIKISNPRLNEYEFPGVYFTLITQKNVKTQTLFEGGRYAHFVSKKLLLQNNWHFNISDTNGHIMQNNTLFPHELDTIVELSTLPNNEVIFHDDIDSKYIVSVMDIDELSSKLPEYEIVNSYRPDTTLLPFYTYAFENNWNGVSKYTPEKSEKEWYQMIVRMIRFDDKDKTIDELMEILKSNYKKVYKNRSLQDFGELYEYLNTHPVDLKINKYWFSSGGTFSIRE
jgi:hypothetical protein